MPAARFIAVQPTLPSKDVSAAIRFYTEVLGFSLAFQDTPDAPHYAGVRRDGIELHLQWHDPAEWAAVERPILRFVVENLDALHDEYEATGATKPGSAIIRTAWGTEEFAFYDLDSNGLTFYREA